jgi:hypothetical protein
MNVMKRALVVFLFSYAPSIVLAATPASGAMHTTSVLPKHHFVVSPGTRLVAGDRSLNEFYILGARSKETRVADHAGADHKVKAKLDQKDNVQKLQKALKSAFHHHKTPAANPHRLASKTTPHAKKHLHAKAAKSSKPHAPARFAKKAHQTKLLAMQHKKHPHRHLHV